MTHRSLVPIGLVILLPVSLLADEPAPRQGPGDPRATSAVATSSGSTPTAAEPDRVDLAQARARRTSRRTGRPRGNGCRLSRGTDQPPPADDRGRGEASREAQGQADDPAGEYVCAKMRFEEADKALQARKKALAEISGGDASARQKAGALVSEQEKLWNLAKNRFDLAIETRKVVAEQVVNLEQMLQRDRQALDRLQNVDQPRAAGSRSQRPGRPEQSAARRSPPPRKPRTPPRRQHPGA